MLDSFSFEKVDNLIKAGELKTALRELKRLMSCEPDDVELLLKTATVYIKLGEKESNRPYYVMAEDHIRKAIAIDSKKESAHDLLVFAAQKLFALGELSAEYKRKYEETEDVLYKKMLGKISAVMLASTPAEKSSLKSISSKFIYYFLITFFIFGLLLVSLINNPIRWLLLGIVIWIIIIVIFYYRYRMRDLGEKN